MSHEIVLVAGADAVQLAEGITLVQDGITPRPRRGQRAGHVRIGVLQEPGRPCHLRLDIRMVGPATPPGRAWRRLVGPRSEQSSAQRYPGAKATKPEEMDGRESERFHSTYELGEPAPGDPEEGRGRHSMELLEGKMEGA